jgi:hypothetical protein
MKRASLWLLLWVGCAESTRTVPDHTGGPDLSSASPLFADLALPAPDLSQNPAADGSSVNPNDQDGDGYLAGVDCDDHDPTVHPGAPEVCNGKDDDCDGFVDNNAIDATTFYPDADHDGLGNSATPVRSCTQPPGWVTTPGDCNDQDPTIGAAGPSEFCIADVGPQAIFVSTTHGNDGNTGASPVEAVKTVSVGMARALKCVSGPCAVVIALGDYDEAIALSAGVNLFGGYSDDFMSRDVVKNVTQISSSQPITISADSLAKDTKLDGLTVLGADFSAKKDGSSSTALRVTNTSGKLTLAHVIVHGGRGARGADGADGSAVACNARGGQGGTSFDCGASTGADGDADADSKSGGGGGPGGGSNCPDACPLVGGDGITNGTSGTHGDDGAAGDAGQAASDGFGQFVSGMWNGSAASDGKRGHHGTGGGGGGAGGSKRFRACFGCGTLLGGRGGDGAPGGCGGGGGLAGGAGGGAFGIVLVDSTITLKDSTAIGGIGGDGGAGGIGRDGAAGSSSVGMGHEDGGSQKCGLIHYYSGSGGIGGVGGSGGAGGGGSGGTGGVSVALARIGSSASTQAGTVTLTAAIGGKGGAGGASSGHAGMSGIDGQAADDHVF